MILTNFKYVDDMDIAGQMIDESQQFVEVNETAISKILKKVSLLSPAS